jgi:hypothetical protein
MSRDASRGLMEFIFREDRLSRLIGKHRPPGFDKQVDIRKGMTVGIYWVVHELKFQTGRGETSKPPADSFVW